MNNSNINPRRMWIVVCGLVFVMFIIMGRLVFFQIIQGEEWAARTSDEFLVVARPDRGTIYDRNGAVVAANGADYQIGVSPNLVSYPEELATQLAPILEMERRDLVARLTSDRPYEMLANRVSPEVGDLVRALDEEYGGLQSLPAGHRRY